MFASFFLRDLEEFVSDEFFCRNLERPASANFLQRVEEFFRVSCSLTAEAGRISRGCLGPSAKRPGSVFLLGFFLFYFFLPRFSPPAGVLNGLCDFFLRPPLPLRRLYLRAGDFRSTTKRLWMVLGDGSTCGGRIRM